MKESEPVIKKIINDLIDQIQKKKILQTQNVEKIDTLTLKYKKELKQILNSSMFGIYSDSKKIAQTEVQKSNFAKPLTEDKFLDVIETENYSFIGDYEYGILKKTRVELISAIKDGKSLSTVSNLLTDELVKLSKTQIERYARTKHTEVMNNARKEYFDSTGVVTGYQFSAIMDDRTSSICSSLNGKFFKADEAPTPALHFFCRSTLIPITKYEEFTPTKSIQGMSPNEFIEQNKGAGFSKYILEKQTENEPLEIKEEKKKIEITDEGVEFETLFEGSKEVIKYSLNGKVFQETISIYDDETRQKLISLKHTRINDEACC
jgi:SPP1 gp7 family putative phage head morphogenesis protein